MQIEQAAELFKALGDPTRIKIIKQLYHNETFYVGQLLEMVDCSQSTLSYHLMILYECGLVSYQKKGKQIFYYCNHSRIDELLKYITKN